MQNFDIIIIGGGAAGLMCAGIAKQRGRKVLVLEHAAKVGQKIRISGGGRANFTNLHATHGITYHEKSLGQLFCDDSAQQITDMLLDEADGITIETGINVTHISKVESQFIVKTDRKNFTASSLVIATGGPSIPKMGSSGFGYDIAKQFGLNVIEPRPGLVPLTFDTKTLTRFDGLSGVSLDASVNLGKVHFTEALLFTHKGLSGPVILQISSYWRDSNGDTITINFLPGIDMFIDLKEVKNSHPKKDVRTALAQRLPKRLAQKIIDWATEDGVSCDGRLAETSNKSLRALAERINAWQVIPNGSEGYRTAEVTVGGVDTKELSSQTMAVRSVPDLYFIGETVDVTGHLGGFNFQWAWASGYACGQVA
jgi:predicted Rossmann fold flavoprotein